MTAIDLLPLLPRIRSILLALWLSPETSTPFFALPYHFKMHLETLPHFRLGATLVRLKPLCEPLACVRGENEDGNFDARGSADVKHNVYSES